jgi:hypothetical protein
MVQMSQVLEYAHEKPCPQTRHIAEAITNRTLQAGAYAPFATLDQTVSALKGDVPGGSLERLDEPSRYLTVVWNASMSELGPPLWIDVFYTPRWSEAKPR